eukprot:2816259-Pyramimonas_sp.AAC.1
MPPEALSFDSELSHAWKDLYDDPGGDQVDGSPPAPVKASGARNEKLEKSRFPVYIQRRSSKCFDSNTAPTDLRL